MPPPAARGDAAAAAAAAAAADGALARLAERLLTLVGVPLLLAAIAFTAGQLWREREAGAKRDAALELANHKLETLSGRLRDEVEAANRVVAEAVRRGEAARLALSKAGDERDAQHDRQIAELQGANATTREMMARVGEKLDGMGAAIGEIKGLLQRPLSAPGPPARAVDRLPAGGWGHR